MFTDKALPIVGLTGALMCSLFWGFSQRSDVTSLRNERDRALTRAEHAERDTRDLADRLSSLEDEWHTLSVVRKAIDLSPPLRPEEPPPELPGPRAGPPAAPPPAPSAAPAILSLNSIPPSTCLLDGASLGTTPQLRVPVAPGKHVVQFVTPDVSVSRPVTVVSGEAKTVTATLAKPGPVASGDGF